MAQPNFGSNTSSTAPVPNFSFSAKPAAPTFGSLASGQPSASTAPTFGSIGASQPSGSITFGTPIASVAPTPQQTTGLAFGAPTLNFGTPATSTPATGLGFGAPAPKTTGLSFGGTPSVASSFSLNFGGASTAPGLTFGANTPSTAAGLSFGAPVSSTAGFSLGTSSAQTTATGLFGNAIATSASQQLGGLNFAAPAVTSATTGFSLGGTSSTATGFSLGLTSTPATLSFGAPATTTSGLNFGLGGTSTAATPSLNFKSPGFTPATTSAGGLNFSFGAAKTQTTPSLTLGTTTTQTPSVGLGGVDSSITKSGTVTTGRADTIAAKENLVPNEILQTIESFKTFVKEQKAHSSDVSRGSARPFLKVGEDIDLLNSIMCEVGNELLRNMQVANKLKNDSAKCLHDAEMAQRTYDTPPSLQFENTAPMQYFIDLVNKFEQDLQAIRIQIDVTDKHVQSLQEPRFLTSQELSLGMRRLHDTFVALAGRLQSVHTQVESQKEQYLNLRKYILKDPTNIFLKPAKDQKALNTTTQGVNKNTASGPTPFSAMGTPNMGMMMAQQQVPNKPPPAYPSTNTTLNFGTPNAQLPTSNLLTSGPALGANTSLFGYTSALGQSPGPDTSGFQLQNPPLGNKRGKR